jgi:transposase
MLRALVAKLEARIEELERRLAQNSQNSSRPPSSNPPSVKLPPKQKRSGRKPGGQPGHDGSHRALLPASEVDETKECWPTTCEGCHEALPAVLRTEVGEALRHQVVEIPPVKAHVTEYRLHAQHCDVCGCTTQADLPAGVPSGAFGPRLRAVIALFTGAYRVSKRVAESALSDLFGVELSLGSVSAAEQAISKALAAPVEEARQHVRGQGVLHADETGWREARKRAWLWIAATPLVAVFLVHAKRSAVAARELLGDFAGILVTDRWSAYRGWMRRQICWAHLLRDFNFFAESKGTAGVIGKRLVRLTHKVFRNWHRVRDGTMTRDAFQRSAKSMRGEIERLLKRAKGCQAHRVGGMAEAILTMEPYMWTFINVEGVEPTNNIGERGIRPAVLWRKGSFGTHSQDGSRFVERMMTVVVTLRLQKRSVFDFLVDASEAASWGRSPPSLLPNPA